jgi:hypothetical protein
MPKINIIYSKEFDIQRVVDTVKRIDWYVENGYNLRSLSFPKILDIEKIKDYSVKEIEESVLSEYNEDLYKDNKKFLIDNSDKIFQEIESAFSKSGLLYKDEYNIYLTKYGIGGSYNLPNIVIINLNNSFNISMLRTIIHEIVHLAIEEDVTRYKIDQKQKERIVDLFFIKNFPRRIFMQKIYSSINTEKIDQTFDDNFPNMESVIKKISE